jgi:hypothetical protein
MFSRFAAAFVALGVVIVSTSLSKPVYAGDADVCYQASADALPQKSHAATQPFSRSTVLTSKTLFDCPRAGKHTLPELAQDGWSIVAVQPVMTDQAMRWMVVIQKK